MFGSILSNVVGFLLGLLGWRKAAPAAPTVQDQTDALAGAQGVALAIANKEAADVQKAADAANASQLNSLRNPESLRAPDPNSID